MGRVVIIVGHTRRETFCEALGEAYKSGAEAGGHEARLFVTSRLDFDPILHEAFEAVQPLEPDLAAARDALQGADHVVLIFPLWLGDVPAILKGFIERVLQPDLVEPSKTGRFVKIFKGKTAQVIVTMATPSWAYRWWFGAPALKTLRLHVLGFLGVAPVRSTVFGNIRNVSAETRARWLDEVREMGQRLA